MRGALMLAASLLALFAVRPAAAEKLTVVTQETPGLVHENDRAEPGFFPEILGEVAKRSGVALPFEFMPWKRAQEVAQSTPDTLIVPLTRTPDREASYAWTLKIIAQNVTFMTLGTPVDSIEAAKRLGAVAVVAGTPFEAMLKQAGLQNIEAVQDGPTAFRMLEGGRVDAFFGQDLATMYAWRKLGGDAGKLVSGKPISQAVMYAGGNPQISAETTKKLNAALTAVRQDGTYAKVFVHYYGINPPAGE